MVDYKSNDQIIKYFKGLLDVILNYSHTWSVLQKYDEDKLLNSGKLKSNKLLSYIYRI